MEVVTDGRSLFFRVLANTGLQVPKGDWRATTLVSGHCTPDIGGVTLLATDGLLAIVHNTTIDRYYLVHLANFEQDDQGVGSVTTSHKVKVPRKPTERELRLQAIIESI